jgi:hypothetical protein
MKSNKVIGLENSKYYNKIIKYIDILDLKLDKEEYYFALVILIEIGKLFAKTKENCFIETKEFINIGYDKFKKREFKNEIDDDMYLCKMYEVLSNLLYQKKIDYNTIIFKDATASGLQNYGMVLGYNKDMVKYINLNGDD